MPIKLATIGRNCQYIDCRLESSGSLGYGIGRGGTASHAYEEDLIAVAMDPTERHIPFPVCDITQRLRLAGIKTSVLILKYGKGTKSEESIKASAFTVSEEEFEIMKRANLLLFHHGNISKHISYKQNILLRKIQKPSIIVCQCPIDYEDLAKEGTDTSIVKPLPEDKKTKGEVIGIVTEVIRGLMCPEKKINEIKNFVFKAIHPEIEKKEEKEGEGIKEEKEVIYENTGSRGKIEEIREIKNYKFALIETEKHKLFYRLSHLKPT